MSRLLEPVAVGQRIARNRVVFGPHETNLARRRSVSERHVAYYRRRAAGGAGVVIVEEASVHESDWPYERCPLAVESAEGWEATAAACHEEGALVIAALGHAGGQGSSAYSQAPLWAPSRVPEVSTREVPKSMEPDDIEAVLDGFSQAAALAASSGLDGVELNTGQFSLLRQFLSGLTNHRGDAWGRDRTLFVRRAIQVVRRAAPDLVVGLRMSCDELAPWAGIVPLDGARLAAGLAPGVDYLTVVRGSIFTVSATRPDGHVEPAFNRELTLLVRQAVPEDTKVVAQGSVVDVAPADAMVTDGVADLVEMTRAQIADPDLVDKLQRAGVSAPGVGGSPGARRRPARIRPCILCNQWCQVRDVRNPIVSCVGEPASGHETAHEPLPAPGAVTHNVLVVGGGPAGLECARVAALAGHRVTLDERAELLGGAVRVAAAGAGRHRLVRLVEWLEGECRLLGVQIRCGRTTTAVDLEAHDGPAVLCTGSVPGRRSYTVAPGAVVLDPAEALGGAGRVAALPHASIPLPAGPVLVWDPIGGPIGVSVAESLRAEGRAVGLATPDMVVGQQLARSGDLAPANARLHTAGVELLRHVLLRAVEPGRCVTEDVFTGERTVHDAVAVVDAGHRLPNTTLREQAGGRFPLAGDAVAPRGIGEAILDGRRAALGLGTTPGPAAVGPTQAQR